MATGNKDWIETLQIEPAAAERLAGSALPFGGAASTEVACQVLDVPAGTLPVPVVLGTVLWRNGGALRLTVIARASFSMLTRPPMAPALPDPFRTTDAHHKNRPLAHVVAANDRVPWKASVDVTVLGHARAPGGRAIPEMAARLTLRQGGAVVIDKAVRVVGDRGAPGEAPKPFDAIPIVYERARGGRDAPANPIGRSQDDDEQPNILDPSSPLRPAGFGPVAAAWQIRGQRLGDRPRRMLDEPIVELPQGFDWSYFQAAPPDQIVSQLAPDAALVLEGFHAERPRVEVALPRVRAVGAVYGLDAASPDAAAALAFRADTLHVDADRWLCSVTWRACVDVREEARLGHLLVAAGVGLGGRDPAIPDRRPPPTARVAAQPSPALAPFSPTATLAVGGGEAPPITLPFGKRPAVETLFLDAPTPVAVLAPPAPPAPPPRTLVAVAEAPAAPPAPAPGSSPWAPAPAPAPAPRPQPEKRLPRKVDIQRKLYGKKT